MSSAYSDPAEMPVCLEMLGKHVVLVILQYNLVHECVASTCPQESNDALCTKLLGRPIDAGAKLSSADSVVKPAYARSNSLQIGLTELSCSRKIRFSTVLVMAGHIPDWGALEKPVTAACQL